MGLAIIRPIPALRLSSEPPLAASSISASAIISWASGAAAAAGAGAPCPRLVSLCGTTAMTSPPSVTVGRGGTIAWSRDASNASGASAIRDSETSFQGSPERFWTMPHACRLAPSLSTTKRYDGRQTGVAAM